MNKTSKSNRNRNRVVWLVSLAIVLGAIFIIVHKGKEKSNTPSSSTQQTVKNAELEADQPKKGTIKEFTGMEFRELYDSFAYPNSQDISETTGITGDVGADRQIRKIAEERGYKKRSAPVSDTFVDVGKGMLLQERASKPWFDLKAAAAKDGYNLSLTAAYRSAEEQKQLFLSRLGGLSLVGIANGQLNAQVSNILRTTSIPGYSRHHTGYTIDTACDNDPAVTFEQSSCFRWLSQNNYLRAKEHGWIPSYPDGAGKQGPDPESWEYVWVGKEPLTE